MKSLYRSVSFTALVVGSSLAFWFAAPARAATIIDYTMEGTGSGTLNGTSFTNEPVEMTLQGDASNVVMTSPGFFQNPSSTAAGTPIVTVAGVGTDTVKNMSVIANPSIGVGFFGSFLVGGGGVFWNLNNPALAGYDLAGPIGPISGSPGLFIGRTLQTELGGGFELTSMGTSTFEANVVPLPPALYLFGSALAAAFWLGRRNRSTVSA